MGTRAGLDHNVVIQTAAILADTTSLEEVSLATLAAQLGVRTPTLYHYVAGLPGLRRELALLGLHELNLQLGRAVMGKAGDDAIIALAETYRAFAKEHPGLYAAIQHAPPADDKELQAAGNDVVDIVLRVLAAYHIPREDAIHSVRMLRSIVHGFSSLELVGAFGLPQEIDETYHRLVKMLIRDLKTYSET